MKNKQLLFVMVLFSLIFSSLNAVTIKEGSLKEPNSNRVILVGKVSLKKPIDLEARKEAFSVYKTKQIGKGQDCFYRINDKKAENEPDFGETFFLVVKKDKSGTYYIKNVIGSIWATLNPWYKFALPANVKITIPEDAKYVYIGNFQYELDYALRTVGFKHIDEYSQAQKELNLATGKKTDLYRAEIQFVEE